MMNRPLTLQTLPHTLQLTMDVLSNYRIMDMESSIGVLSKLCSEMKEQIAKDEQTTLRKFKLVGEGLKIVADGMKVGLTTIADGTLKITTMNQDQIEKIEARIRDIEMHIIEKKKTKKKKKKTQSVTLQPSSSSS